jgi:serine/threonine protein kinase
MVRVRASNHPRRGAHAGHPHLTKRSGTPLFMAPEIFARSYSFEVDIWSTGVLLYQLYSRRFPFWEGDSYCRALSLEEVARAINEAEIKFDYGPWLGMSREGLAFVGACLERDARRRISVDAALNHPWLAQTLGPAYLAAAGAAAAPGRVTAQGVAANHVVSSSSLQHGCQDAALAV